MKSNMFIAEVDGLCYLLNPTEKTAKVTYKNVKKWLNDDYAKGGLIIPSSINYRGVDYNVTEILDRAFCGCNQLRYISVPDTVTEIGKDAFNDCLALEVVELPDTLIRIGEMAFWGCSKLHIINIPRGLQKIECMAFCNCPSLKTVKIPWTLYYIEFNESVFDDGVSLDFEDGPERLDPY